MEDLDMIFQYWGNPRIYTDHDLIERHDMNLVGPD